MMKLSLAAILFGTAAAGQLSSLGDYKVFESLAAAPTPWTLKEDSHVDESKSFKLRIHLKNQNMASFQQKVIDAATPDHTEYGNHFSRVELRSMLAPKEESAELVLDWIKSQGLSEKTTVDEDWIIVDGTIGDAEKLLQTEYQWFENSDVGKLTVRTLAYSLPSALHAHVGIIAPTIMFGGMTPQISTIVKGMQAPNLKAAKSSASDVHDGLDVVKCNVTITPDCLMALYKFKHFRGSRRNGNEIALAGFLEQYAQYDDLEQFLETYEPDQAGFTFSTQLINGGLNTQDNDPEYNNTDFGEANLDIQYGLSLAYPTQTTYFSTGGRPPETTEEEVDNEPYLEFLTYLLKLDKIPQTISISYGDREFTVPDSYAHTICDLFSQVTARGVTILASSGDSGSGSDCLETNPDKLLYTPALPASCPWVTAVGVSNSSPYASTTFFIDLILLHC
jgi:tripeptidyl-peptidase-1